MLHITSTQYVFTGITKFSGKNHKKLFYTKRLLGGGIKMFFRVAVRNYTK